MPKITSIGSFCVRKRDGRHADFDATRIGRAIEKAFKAERNIGSSHPLDDSLLNKIQHITDSVVQHVAVIADKGEELSIEKIQDCVETQLMRDGFFSVARRYIVYREDRNRTRALRRDLDVDGHPITELNIRQADGTQEKLDPLHIRYQLVKSCSGMDGRCSPTEIEDEVMQSVYDGISVHELDKAMLFAARSRIEKEPSYSFVAAQLLLKKLYREALRVPDSDPDIAAAHREQFEPYIEQSILSDLLSPELLNFDLSKLAHALNVQRDHKFGYIGLQTLYDRYLLHHEGRRVETPQYFWMRVAMGLAAREGDQAEERAIEFYDALSTFRLFPLRLPCSTPEPNIRSSAPAICQPSWMISRTFLRWYRTTLDFQSGREDWVTIGATYALREPTSKEPTEKVKASFRS